MLERYDDAIAAYDLAILANQGDFDEAGGYANRGFAEFFVGKYEAALADFERALAIGAAEPERLLKFRELTIAKIRQSD